MAADRARVSYDPSRQWRGLVAQQGRVTVEADWNEAAAIDEERDRQVTLDVVGPVGTPDGGYVVTPEPAQGERGRWTPGRLTIGKGTLFLGGERLELRESVRYLAQPDWLDHSTDPMWRVPGARREAETRHELVYLLAFEQEASAVEDPALADVALGGPDTMQRRRMLQHFLRRPSESGSCEGSRGAFERALTEHRLRFDPATMTARSTARLLVSFVQAPGTAGGPELPAVGSYLGAENQMIRVMVTHVDDETGEPTIVWGFDDASFLYRVGEATSGAEDTTLTLASAPVDSFHYPAKGQAVELLRDAVKLADHDYIASSSGFVTEVSQAYQPTSKTLTVAGSRTEPGHAGEYFADYLSKERTPQRYLRVWQKTAHARPGKPVPLADTGVTVTLSSDSGFRVGDFWHFAVRPLQPTTIYPERYASEPQPPDGPRFWSCPLAVVTWHEDEDEDEDEDEEDEEDEEEDEEEREYEDHDRRGREGRRPHTESCLPRFSGLAKLASASGGCCTVDVGPERVSEGGSLQELIDGYARQGPITVCLRPGTYTLTAPLRLGPEFDGITLQAPDRGVILRGPERAGEEFVLGLITVVDASSVTIRGIELAPPPARFSPSERSFGGLHPANRRLLGEFRRGLHVAIGISVRDTAALTVEECSFDLPEPDGTNLLAAGIMADGAIDGLRVTGCSFHPGRPGREHWHRWPPRALRNASLAFHGLAAGTREDVPHELTFGYLQVPRFESRRSREDRAHRLDDAVITDCLFHGVTVPALVMAHIGSLRMSHNTVRDGYGGFWLVSLTDPELRVIFDRIAVGYAETYLEASSGAGGVALMDRIFAVSTAMARVLPEPAAGERRLEPRRIIAADPALLEVAREVFREFYQPATDSGEVPDEIDALFSDEEDAGPQTESQSAAPAWERRMEGGRDRWRPRLKLDLGDCQIDAIVADSPGGAGLIVADFTSETGSVLLHDNRIRGRFPDGEMVFIGKIAEACVTGNIVANETRDEEDAWRSRSLGLFTATARRAVAITGNVFVAPYRLPRREYVSEDLPPAAREWALLNTVIPYGEPEPDRRAVRQAEPEREPDERAAQYAEPEREPDERPARPTEPEPEDRATGQPEPEPPERGRGILHPHLPHHLQLVVTDGPTAGQRFELHEGETIIGREQGSDIHIDHPTVSHNQAILRVRGHEATIEDLHSTNGTRVNDVLIERQTPIGPGDRIGVGGVHLVVERHEIIRRGERQR
jgi:pSer/pThr/pTyr-binding forkhead associated (FHA) protein